MATNKDIVARFMTEVWNGNKLEALDAFIDPTYYDYSYEPRNREGLESMLKLTQTAFPGHETIIEEIASDGETVAICQTLRGIHTGTFRGIPASGRQIEVGGYRFFKVVNGKITSHRGMIDLPALLRQIGADK